MFKVSTTLLVVWIVSFVTSGVLTQEDTCDLQPYPRHADYTEDNNKTQIFLTKGNVTFCHKQACQGISLEKLNACNNRSIPDFDEYLRLLNYTLKSKSDCEDTGEPDACQAVDEYGEPKHDGDKCCRTYYGVVPENSPNNLRPNATGSMCYIVQPYTIGECRTKSRRHCEACQNQTSLAYLWAFCQGNNGYFTPPSYYYFEINTYCSCQQTNDDGQELGDPTRLPSPKPSDSTTKDTNSSVQLTCHAIFAFVVFLFHLI